MRRVVLDTETTGLEPARGHRIIELACIELLDRRRTDNVLHHFINPEREVDAGAFEIHGISLEDLEGEPLFRDIAGQFIEFIRDSELIIHNAEFDGAFINAELARLGEDQGKLEDLCTIVDTLQIARELHPGQKNSLDALCERYRVDNSQRGQHSALLDAQLLLDVYLAMTGGQSSLSLDDEAGQDSTSARRRLRLENRPASLKVVEPTAEETAAHLKMLALIERESGTGCLWGSEDRRQK